MKLVGASDRVLRPPARARVYFVHIPKTAGVTLKAFLEDNMPHGEALVIDEWRAATLTTEELAPYTFYSGHYPAEVLDRLPSRPQALLTVVREPVARFRSWWAHCKRLTGSHRYRDMLVGRAATEVLAADDRGPCTQAHWLARGLTGGSGYSGVPSIDEAVRLLGQVELVGITDELERFKQLVAFRFHWPAPPLGWRLNRRPTAEPSSDPYDVAASDDELRELLAVDSALYAEASSRFWRAYAAMLSALDPAGRPYAPEEAAATNVTVVNDWLRARHTDSLRGRWRAVTAVTVPADAAVTSDGWWWREGTPDAMYRWTGPGTAARMLLPPLVTGRCYEVVADVVHAADWQTWDGTTLVVNGHSIPAVRERIGPEPASRASLRLRAVLPIDAVYAQDGLTEVTIQVPAAQQALTSKLRLESFDTVNPDTRFVGVAVHAASIQEVRSDGQAQPITLRRRQRLEPPRGSRGPARLVRAA